MAKTKKLLALVLAMAMVFSMLPTFAAAEDAAVEDVADVAVETVDAPVDVQVVDAIETAPTETVASAPVKADLQSVADKDAEQIAAGMIVKVLAPGANADDDTAWQYFNTVAAGYAKAASYAAADVTAAEGAAPKLVLLRDHTVVDTKSSGVAGATLNNGAVDATNKSCTYPNDEDPTVNGFWFDFGGHTLTVQTTANAFYCSNFNVAGINKMPFNLRNGSLIYQYTGAVTTNCGVFRTGYASLTPAYGAGACTMDITLDHMELYSLASAGTYTTGGSNYTPVLVSYMYQSNLNIRDSKVINTDYAVAMYAANTSTSGNVSLCNAFEHNINISGKSIVGTARGASAVRDVIAIIPAAVANMKKTDIPYTVNINTEGDDVTLACAAFAANNASAKVTVNEPTGYEKTTVSIAAPSAADIPTETTAYDAAKLKPAFGAAANYTAWVKPAPAPSIAKVVAPNGTETGYTDLNAAYVAAAAFKAADVAAADGKAPQLILLTDYTLVDTTDDGAGNSLITAGAETRANNLSWGYENDVKASDGTTVTGFWFDLGGHTLTIKAQKTPFYNGYGIPMNFKNGNIYYQCTGDYAHSGLFRFGYGSAAVGSGSDGIYKAALTLDGVKAIRLPGTVDSGRGPVVYSKMALNEFNFIDSTVIDMDAAKDSNYLGAIYVEKTTATISDNLCTMISGRGGYYLHMNLAGDVNLGSTQSELPAVYVGAFTDSKTRYSCDFTVSVAEESTFNFLGNAAYTVSAKNSADLRIVAPRFETATLDLTLPDASTIAEVTTVDAVPSDLTAASYTAWVEAAPIPSIVKVIAPDGTETGYEDLNAAYKAIAAFTAADVAAASGKAPQLVLLKDYTLVDTTDDGAAASLITAGAELRTNNFSWGYENDVKASDGTTVTGFWFDLDGHTLTIKSQKTPFYASVDIPFNFKNGNIYYQSTGDYNHSGLIRYGYASVPIGNGTDGIYKAAVTLDGVNAIRLPSTVDSGMGPIIYSRMALNEINIIDSTVISADAPTAGGAITVDKTTATLTDNLCTMISGRGGYSVKVNLVGDVKLGATESTLPAIYVGTINDNRYTCDFTINVAEESTFTFFGSDVYSSKATSGVTITAPICESTTRELTLPDASTIAGETATDAKPEYLEPVSYPAWVLSCVTAEIATYTAPGGTEGAIGLLADAFKAWEENGYTGTIKLYGDHTPADVFAVKADFGGTEHYYTSNPANDTPRDAIVVIAAEMAGGDLTLDLNGHTVTAPYGNVLFATDPELDGFDLKIVSTGTRGELNSRSSGILLLQGSSIGLIIDNVDVNVNGYFAYEIRGKDSYTILRDCNFVSDTKDAFYLCSHDVNYRDTTLVYYVKNCTADSSHDTKNKSSGFITEAIAESGCTRRKYSVIFDGTFDLISYLGKSKSYHYSLTGTPVFEGDDAPYTCSITATPTVLTTETGAATLTAADLTFNFTNLSDAARFADLFGRCGKMDATLTLNEDATITAPFAVGTQDYQTNITLDLNGKTVTDVKNLGFFAPTVGMASGITLMNAAAPMRLAAGVLKLDNGSYVFNKRSMFTKWSLNLKDNVSINFYTGTDPDAIRYEAVDTGVVGEITEKTDDAWILNNLTAKEMRKAFNVAAMKTTDGKTFIDYTTVSVKGYVDMNPSEEEGYEGDQLTAFNNTLESMLIYGKAAEKYFNKDYSVVSAGDLEELGIAAAPEIDTSILADAARTVNNLGDYTKDNEVTTGFYGVNAALKDSIHLNFFFYGLDLTGDEITVTVDGVKKAFTLGDRPNTSDTKSYQFVNVAIDAKNFDSAVTVDLGDGRTVTDSVSGYTRRFPDTDNAYNMVQALRAYGAAAIAWAEKK